MLRVLQLNFNSLKSSRKKAEHQILIEPHNPDTIDGCESKLDDTHASHSIFPETYVVERNDRNRHGARVILATKAELNPMPENHLSTSIDNCWCSVQPQKTARNCWLVPSIPLSVTHLTSLNTSAGRSPKCSPWNDPKHHRRGNSNAVWQDQSSCRVWWKEFTNWTDDDEPVGRGTCMDGIKNKLQCIHVANCYELCQHQHDITRPESQTCLDLVFTNNPSITKNANTTPDTGDHLAVLYDIACKVPRNTIPRLKLFKFNKANIPNMAQDMNSFHQTLHEAGLATRGRKTGPVSTMP